jgi:hypothetical protein
MSLAGSRWSRIFAEGRQIAPQIDEVRSIRCEREDGRSGYWRHTKNRRRVKCELIGRGVGAGIKGRTPAVRAGYTGAIYASMARRKFQFSRTPTGLWGLKGRDDDGRGQGFPRASGMR